MTWIPKKNQGNSSSSAAVAASGKQTARSHGHSLETPVIMNVRRLPAPVYATLMEITASGAKIRSLILMDRGAEVEFDLGAEEGATHRVRGRVEHRRNAPSGARFEYHLVFQMMTEAEIDALAKYVRELELRAASARSMQAAIDALPTTDGNRRGSYRALTSFAVRYRREGAPEFAEGRVGDLSSSGIRMNCREIMPVGTMVDLRLTLPSSVLDVYPEETVAIDLSTATRRTGRPDMRRPFAELSVRARVVTRFAPARDREVYGIAFLEIDGYQREEIARFTHALQLAKIRG